MRMADISIIPNVITLGFIIGVFFNCLHAHDSYKQNLSRSSCVCIYVREYLHFHDNYINIHIRKGFLRANGMCQS